MVSEKQTCFEPRKLAASDIAGAVLIGVGVLSWNRRERVCDRYGSVFVMKKGVDSFSEHMTAEACLADMTFPPDGSVGRLVCEVTQTRQSTHIGDIARCLVPRTPAVGDLIELGHGRVCSEDGADGWFRSVGLEPIDDERRIDWLNPRALYDCHEQTVRLLFVAD